MKKASLLFFDNLRELQNEIQRLCGSGKVYILTDDHVSDHCLSAFLDHDLVWKDAEIIEIEAGENSKSLEICAQIWEHLLENKVDRDSILLNLGGGVISDIGGFIASTYKRGIRHINIPTSLLAMVDASIGGKTGIDFHNIKNVIGTFNEAESILVYPEFISTLPIEHIVSGFAEMLKHAIIDGPELWRISLNCDFEDQQSIQSIIPLSAQVKNKIIQEDPHEKNLRKILNLGHTVGHAIESCHLSSATPMLHGEAVALGIIVETMIAQETGLANEQNAREIIDGLLKFFNPKDYFLPPFTEIEAFILNDKKNTNGEVFMALPAKIGEVFPKIEVPLKTISRVYSNFEKIHS